MSHVSHSPARLLVANCNFVLATADVNNATTTTTPGRALDRSPPICAATPPDQSKPITALSSPPQTPTTSLPHSPHPSATMNRAPLHGAPPHGALGRGQAPPPRGPRGAAPSYGSQDARGSHGAVSSHGLQEAHGNRGAPPIYGTQDARGSPGVFGHPKACDNYAVQPVANVSNMKLKKAAVKIVSANAPSQAATPAADSSPRPEPVKAMPKEVER